MSYPTNYRYTKSHQWLLIEGQTATIGITDYAQETLGDIKFVELPRVGDPVEADSTFGSIESVKSVSEVFSPVSGGCKRVEGPAGGLRWPVGHPRLEEAKPGARTRDDESCTEAATCPCARERQVPLRRIRFSCLARSA